MLSTIYRKFKELVSGDSYVKSKENAESFERNLNKNKSHTKIPDNFIKSKNQSLKDSQGVDDFSGSGYKAPGNVDHEKTNSNMGRRNFEG